MPNSEDWQRRLNADLKEAGLPLDRVQHTSVLPERIFDEVSNSAIKSHSTRVHRIIARVNPRFILLLGNEALLTTLGKSGISKYRGRVYDYPQLHGTVVIATVSHAVTMRNPRQRPGYLADVRLLSNIIFGRTGTIQPPHDVIHVHTNGQLRALKQLLGMTDEIGFDVETHSEYWRDDGRIVSLAGTVTTYIDDDSEPAESTFVLPLYHPESPWKHSHRQVLNYLKPELENIRKATAHNSPYDTKWMIQYGTRLLPTFDTMLVESLLDEDAIKALKPLGVRRLGVEPWGIDTKNLLETPLDEIEEYNALDAFYMMEIKKQQILELKEKPHLARILKFMTMPAVRDLVYAEMRGVWVDVDRLNDRLPIARKTLSDIENAISDAAGLPDPESGEWPIDAKGRPRERNFNASIFARWMLFEWCQLPVMQRGKEKADGSVGDPSMAEDVLMALREEHPVIPRMLERVKWQKYISSFLVPYSEMYDDDHRIHTNFKLAGTVTGRLSSGKTDEDKITGVRGKVRGINLQQVPRDSFIRGLLGAPPGWVFVQADYSQVELRIAAFIAREMTMIRLYQQGADIHTTTAARVAGIPESEVSKEVRKKLGKPVNFGFLYGMGPTKFIHTAFSNYGAVFNMDEAKAARKAYFDLYPGLLPWHNRCRAMVRKYGRVQSPLGRVRNLPDIYSPDEGVRAEAERQAINSPVQGFASDLAVISMIEINKKLRAEDLPAHCIGLVHDAINFEIREDVVKDVLPTIKEVMEDASVVERKFGVHLDIPIVSDLSVGHHWGDLAELTAEQVYAYTADMIG